MVNVSDDTFYSAKIIPIFGIILCVLSLTSYIQNYCVLCGEKHINNNCRILTSCIQMNIKKQCQMTSFVLALTKIGRCNFENTISFAIEF
jgi:hypothetical protein